MTDLTGSGYLDYVGYGQAGAAVRWPGDARLALSIAVHYQEGAERTPVDGDDGPEGSTNPIEPRRSARDISIETLYEYGPRVGLWRLLRILDEFGAKATFFCAGRALERNPRGAAAIIGAGHEIAAHGYRWVPYHDLTAEEEQADIERAIAALEAVTGRKPLGWHSRATTVRTRAFLEAAGFLYDSDAYDDDAPYLVTVNGRDFLTIPHSLDTSDVKFWPPAMVAGYSTPDDFYQNLVDCFDRLYEEGESATRMMTVSLRLRISGHPSRANQVRRFLQYAETHSGIWVARREDIARWWLDAEPLKNGRA